MGSRRSACVVSNLGLLSRTVLAAEVVLKGRSHCCTPCAQLIRSTGGQIEETTRSGRLREWQSGASKPVSDPRDVKEDRVGPRARHVNKCSPRLRYSSSEHCRFT
jgi:hypothetical protein